MLKLGADELQWIRNVVEDKQIFLVVDETTLSGTQYLHILVGTLEMPHVSYLHDCQPSPCSPNGDSIVQAIDDAIRSLGVNRNSFCLVLYDAARYMVAAGNILKSLYPKLFHVTCVAHLLHNCAMKVKSHFHDVDQLIASIKAVTVKTKQASTVCCYWLPTSAYCYKMGKLVKCCLDYARNLPEVNRL